ncbi:MAG: hypothetical protein ACODAJ_09665, partial [Planctomycetota bacterium]
REESQQLLEDDLTTDLGVETDSPLDMAAERETVADPARESSFLGLGVETRGAAAAVDQQAQEATATQTEAVDLLGETTAAETAWPTQTSDAFGYPTSRATSRSAGEPPRMDLPETEFDSGPDMSEEFGLDDQAWETTIADAEDILGSDAFDLDFEPETDPETDWMEDDDGWGW